MSDDEDFEFVPAVRRAGARASKPPQKFNAADSKKPRASAAKQKGGSTATAAGRTELSDSEDIAPPVSKKQKASQDVRSPTKANAAAATAAAAVAAASTAFATSGDDDDAAEHNKQQSKAASKKKTKKAAKAKPKRRVVDVDEDDSEQEQEQEQEDEEEQATPKKKPKTASKNASNSKTKPGKENGTSSSSSKSPAVSFDHERVRQLVRQHPDNYGAFSGHPDAIMSINDRHPLQLERTIDHPGVVYEMKWSPDFKALATCSSLGTVRLWDADTWHLISEIRDKQEKNIDELFVLCWADGGQQLFAAGRLKDRRQWSDETDDNCTLPCPIKVFNLEGKLLSKLEGHQREITCLKYIRFDGQPYLVSCSEDGAIIKWRLSSLDLWSLQDSTPCEQGDWERVLTISFVPHCGNKYFLAGCDAKVIVFDFESGKIVQSFPSPFSFLCDSLKFVTPTGQKSVSDNPEMLLVSKGVELSKDDEVLFPNKCALHILKWPSTKSGEWHLSTLHLFNDEGFHANGWPLKHAVSPSGRYVLGPTDIGRVYIWGLWSRKITGVLDGMDGFEIRDILFHPFRKIICVAGEESKVWIYVQGGSKGANPASAVLYEPGN